MWKEVDEKTKEKYNSMAKKEKERADKEIAAYKAKKDGEGAAVRTREQPYSPETRCKVRSFIHCTPACASPAPGLQPLHDTPSVFWRLLAGCSCASYYCHVTEIASGYLEETCYLAFEKAHQGL